MTECSRHHSGTTCEGPSMGCAEFDYPESEDACPEHGAQRVIGYDVTRGSDPYNVTMLECGHGVASFGPDDPNVIVLG